MLEHAGRPGRFALALAATAAIALGLSACGDAGSGEDLYSMACARCHGVDRSGLADVAPDLSATSFALEESNDWITDRIHDGFKAMPSFERVLTEEQTASIISYLRDGRSGPNLATAPPTTTAPPPTTIPATRQPTGGPETAGPPVATTATSSAPEASPPTTAAAPGGSDSEVLALGELIFSATGEGCADCHGVDALGTADGPNLLGISKSAISSSLGGGVTDMENIDLTSDELEAVYRYVRFLTSRP
jgi:mono/diheme cytochrome c family protein